MIHFRYSYFKKTSKDFSVDSSIYSGKTIVELVSKLSYLSKLNKSEFGFKVVINGSILDRKKWSNYRLSKSDRVIVLPELKTGNGQADLFQLAVIIGAAYTGGATTAFTGSQFAGAVASATVMTIGSRQLQYLIPTPSLNSNQDPQRESQVYSIEGQSNQVKRLGKVPKIYGEHKVYPNLAATPYTELELDPNTGKLAQYFYAIYHIGLGQYQVSDLRIGSTSIDLFTGCTNRLVDINKPSVDENDFDRAYSKNFELYKGSVRTETVGTELNSDEVNGGAQSNYQITRNCPSNVDLKKQQININFICPSGLISYNSNGSKGAAYIDVDIKFSKVSETVWRSFDDPEYVESSYAVGAKSSLNTSTTTNLYPFNASTFNPDSPTAPYSIVTSTQEKVYKMYEGYVAQTVRDYTVGLKLTSILPLVFSNESGITIGDKLVVDGEVVATVTSTTSFDNGYTAYYVNPVKTYIPLFKCRRITDRITLGPYVNGTKVTTCENSSVSNRITKLVTVGRLVIASDESGAHLASVKFTPREVGEYKVLITRYQSRQVYNSSVINALTVSNILSRYDDSPIQTTKRNSYLEVRLKATGQLSGVIDNLNCVAKSVLDVWNGSSWIRAATSNPAWVFTDLLTGEVNKRAIAKSKLDIDSIYNWAQYCDAVPTAVDYDYYAKRYECNFILDFDITLQNLIAKVTNSCQASLRYNNGLYGVLQDRLQSTPIQLFTPRNSSNFSSTRVFSDVIHGIKVTFVDPNKDWQLNSITVYRTGYSDTNSTNIEEMDSFACTSVEQAFRLGKYFLFQDENRKENIKLTVDFESLVCTRGDYIHYVQPIMKVGGLSARVKTVDSGINQITIDDGFDLDELLDYGYEFRSSTGEIISGLIDSIDSDDTFTLDGDLPEVGDLITIGEVELTSLKAIVKSIEPLDNESATLTLIEQAPVIYDFESIEEIPNYNPSLSSVTDGATRPPSQVLNLTVDANSYTVVGNEYQYYIDLDWDSPEGSSYALFEIHADYGSGYSLVDTSEVSNYRYIVDSANVNVLHSFKVLAVSSSGKKITLVDAPTTTATPLSKSSRPSDITQFNADISNETLQLFWNQLSDLDIKNYSIRFTPQLDGTWERSEQLQVVSNRTTLITTQIRTGTYLIKAIDFNGNESANAKKIQTTISGLNNIQAIDTITDFPLFNGIFDRTELIGSKITLAKSVDSPVLGEEVYYTEGYYYFSDLLNLTVNSQVRLQSNLEVRATTAADLISNWSSLASVTSLYTPQTTDWDVELQYRATSALNSIADWSSLASVTSLAEGNPVVWTEWRKLLITDIQAKFVQFRLKLTSLKSNVSPVVTNASITATMTARVESGKDLICPDTGLDVVFDNSFYATPSINITLQSSENTDYWDITDRSPDGFSIVFYHGGNEVERTFDYQAVGYGKKATEVL